MTDTNRNSRLVTERDVRAIVLAHNEGKRPAWGPDGHDWSWWAYQLAEEWLDHIDATARFTLGTDLLRDHMTNACERGCPYCAKRQRIRTDLLEAVAHRAFHLLDDGGEVPNEPDDFLGSKRDADLLSDALDALEADGWNAHPEDGVRP